MSIEALFSSNIIVPIVVAFIGFLIAVTTAVIAKEHKVSEFRQAWIDDFRDDAATYISSYYDCIHLLECNIHFFESVELNPKYIHKYNESFRILELTGIKLSYRLNPDKDQKCIDTITGHPNFLDFSNVKPPDYSSKLTLLKRMTENLRHDFHIILKSEWERVKKGEKRFVLFVTLGEFFGGTFIIAFFVLLYLAKFPEYFPGIN